MLGFAYAFREPFRLANGVVALGDNPVLGFSATFLCVYVIVAGILTVLGAPTFPFG